MPQLGTLTVNDGTTDVSFIPLSAQTGTIPTEWIKAGDTFSNTLRMTNLSKKISSSNNRRVTHRVALPVVVGETNEIITFELSCTLPPNTLLVDREKAFTIMKNSLDLTDVQSAMTEAVPFY
jgi:hypothetical protein